MMPVDNGRRYRVIRRELRMVHDRNQAASDTPESPVPSVIRIAMRRFYSSSGGLSTLARRNSCTPPGCCCGSGGWGLSPLLLKFTTASTMDP